MKLTPARVADIKAALCDPAASQPQIAKKFKISRSLVSDIANGRRHKNVPWPDGIEPTRKKAGGQHKPLPTFDPTDARILELESEVVHLTEERNRAKASAKASAKTQGLFRAIIKEMDTRIKPMRALPPAWSPPKKGVIEEHAVLHLSDMHADQVVRSEECGGLETYDFPIACARAERLVDTLLQWTQTTLAPNFRFPHLWILMNGDLTSGQIHSHAERSYYRHQLTNCFAIGQLLALMFREVAPHFKHVHVVSVSGNHGRWSPKKNHNAPRENWDTLIAETARMLCREIKNIEFLIPNAYSVNLDINGVGLNLFHGDDIKSNLGLPVYGLMRRQKNLLALGTMQQATPIRYFACGHFHLPATMTDLNGEMLVNGAWLGCDAYSFNSFGGFREPTQLLHGMHSRHGVSWRLPVKLRHETESEGPKRFKIDGGRDVGIVEL